MVSSTLLESILKHQQILNYAIATLKKSSGVKTASQTSLDLTGMQHGEKAVRILPYRHLSESNLKFMEDEDLQEVPKKTSKKLFPKVPIRRDHRSAPPRVGDVHDTFEEDDLDQCHKARTKLPRVISRAPIELKYVTKEDLMKLLDTKT